MSDSHSTADCKKGPPKAKAVNITEEFYDVFIIEAGDRLPDLVVSSDSEAEPEDEPPRRTRLPPGPVRARRRLPPGPVHDQCVVMHISGAEGNRRWFMDGMSNAHVTNDEGELYDVVPCNVQVRGAGATFTVTRKGSVALLVLLPNSEVRRVVLKDVLFSERFPHKIISEIKFSDAGCRIVKQGAQFTVSSEEGRVILEATRLAKRQFFFVIQPSAAQAQAFLASKQAG